MGKWQPNPPAQTDRRPSDSARGEDAPPMSFIVRVSRQESDEYGGWVEEAESGEKTSFLGFGELREVLSRYLAG
jgi:hypothetical protein